MIAELIATGDEIRTGALVDSNSAYIATRLEALGLTVTRHTTVGDGLDQLAAAFQEAGRRADLVVVTGGLGPTRDDRSAEAAAVAAGDTLVFDPEAYKVTERFYVQRRRPMAGSNRKQAMLPESSSFIDNPTGTAPGFRMAMEGGEFFFLPGVPGEMKRMLADSVLPLISAKLGDDRQAGLLHTLSTFGLPESVAGELLDGFEGEFPEFILGFRAKFPEIQVKIYGRGRIANLNDRRLDQGVRWISERLGDRLLAPEEISLEQCVGKLLLEKGATLAVAESCTGGLIGHKLTNVPGSSDYFLLSAVTYGNSAKESVLGVPANILETHGAVHEETARAMAEGARRAARAHYGLSTSGIAGPGGGTPDKPVGMVCIGLATATRSLAKRFNFFYGNRQAHKSIFAATALDMLRLELMGLSPLVAGGKLVTGSQQSPQTSSASAS
jgi:nicotinamide-nucleotide amidase